MACTAPAPTIGDTLFSDWNGNGQQESGVRNIPNITVLLYEDSNGNGRIDAGTDADCHKHHQRQRQYLFSGLAAGNIVVRIVPMPNSLPACTRPPTPTDGRVRHRLLLEVAGVNGMLIGILATSLLARAVGDTVWLDRNGDGAERRAGNRVANIGVALWADRNGDDGCACRDDSTDADGHYGFENLPVAATA